MKISQIFSMLILIFVAGISFTFAQNDSKKDKSKDKKEAKSIEIKTNLLVQNSAGKFADDVKQEDVKIYEDGVEQKITSFAKNPKVLNVGFVIDNTGSMRPLLDEITKMASVLVANLQPADEAFIVRFVDRSKITIEQEWTSNKTSLNNTLQQSMFIEGGQSAITDALYLSAEKLLEREKQDKSKRYALILLSDGEERDSYYKFEELLDPVKATSIQIFMLSYANLAPNNPKNALKFSNRVSFETGGITRLLGKKRTEQEIINALKAIVGELRSNYVVAYTSTNQRRDGVVRKLTVQIADSATGERRQPTMRENFVVPEEK